MADDVTQILSQIDAGDPSAANQLLPAVYDELRKLAAAKLAHERPGQTLQATALVHEAYLRLVRPEETQQQRWNGRGHFFAAAAEAMRRILVEQARRRGSAKHGGGLVRHPIDDAAIESPEAPVDVLAINEALEEFESVDRAAAEIVKLRYFAGLTLREAAEAIGVSPSTADRYWAYARAWLHCYLEEAEAESAG